jgi:hypothetical protein
MLLLIAAFLHPISPPPFASSARRSRPGKHAKNQRLLEAPTELQRSEPKHNLTVMLVRFACCVCVCVCVCSHA